MITVVLGQTIFDVAIQHCGNANAAFQIAALNELSLTDDLTPGQSLQIPDVMNIAVVKYYKLNSLIPATGV